MNWRLAIVILSAAKDLYCATVPSKSSFAVYAAQDDDSGGVA